MKIYRVISLIILCAVIILIAIRDVDFLEQATITQAIEPSAQTTTTLNTNQKTQDQQSSATLPTTITLMSWNLEWLTLTPFKYAPPRTTQDYQALARIFTDISPDILAFQEVDSLTALELVVPKEKYQFFFSDRQNKPSEIFNDVNQFTGFAVRNGLIIKDPQDVVATNKNPSARNSKLRYASYITLRSSPTAPPVHLLSVHLKSGCTVMSKNKPSSRKSKACRTLAQQLKVLSEWINNHHNQHVIIAGDFNHLLSSDYFWLQEQLDSSKEVLIPLTIATEANCFVKQTRVKKIRYRRYKQLIDHVFISQTLLEQQRKPLQPTVQYRFQQDDVKQFQLTDHCPIVSKIQLP
ncbi:endonuclease/exonuclease/phosphatase family protein [Photobacterium sanguinicancri]|uniref:endonuclease/exonuclease/phosphatase family protein n=1 Tax=Photobacterium sanguinicancri TaxID=875932 RepID=UPI0026E11F52|nr:endonuclease/exonuclease/phosphatase family protein [Photobacterium sanguinicancri]MDO6500495.1 endonuclease/exonuclease/phosphatase family protein [Photobacterium sanguinicancri]